MDEDRTQHMKALQEADQALAEAQRVISAQRTRLNVVMREYDERGSMPRA